MFQTLEKLRQKPDRTKKQIAFGGALLLTLIIFLIWLSVVYPDLRQEKATGDKVNSLEKSPTTSFSETFSNGLSSISAEFNKIKSAFSSFSTQPAYFVATSTSTTTENQ